MKFNEFYDFSIISQEIAQFEIIDLMPSAHEMVCFHRLLMADYKGISFPVNFKKESGNKLKDVLGTGTATLFLISNQMKNILIENQLSGWEVFPVRLFDKNGDQILGYDGFSITGRCGPIDYRKSAIIHKRILEGGPLWKYYKGLYVGLEEWDGSDFFLPQDYFGTIITKKAAEILKKNKISNIVLRNLADIEVAEENV